MSTKIVALHGFLGRGSDWQAVREASADGWDWICPDLFAPGAAGFEPPAVEGPCWLAGYSFGARLALRWLQQSPDRWRGALLLSVDPGNFQSDTDRAARRASDAAWAESFGRDGWEDLMCQWQVQPVLAGSPAPRRAEEDFDRGKLAQALLEYSVADQFTDALRLPPRLTWMAGGRDRKFVDLQTAMRDSGFPGTFVVVEGAGHRLLPEAPCAVASALDDLVA